MEIVRIPLPTTFTIGPVNVFLVKTDPPALVDAAVRTDQAYDLLVQHLREHGYSPRDLGTLFLTHNHVDHMGLAPRLAAESGATTYAHPLAVSQLADFQRGLEEGQAFLHEEMGRLGVPGEEVARALELRAGIASLGESMAVDHGVEDGQTVAGLRGYHVPGHSSSDILFLHEATGAAFAGDHLLKTVTPNPIIQRPRGPGMPRPRCLVEYETSLLKTRALPIRVCYPGHGAPFENHRDIIDRILERYERRTIEVRAMLTDVPVTPYELTLRLFPSTAAKMLHFALSVAVGHLEVLEQRGLAVEEEQDGVLHYRRAG